MHTRTVQCTRLLAPLALAGACISLACNKPTQLFSEPALPTATQPTGFTDDDRQVIEAALVSLITDPEYRPNRTLDGNYDSIGLLDTTRAAQCQTQLDELKNCPSKPGLTPEAQMAECWRNETIQVLDHAGWDPRVLLVETGKYRFSSLAGTQATYEDTHPTSNGLITARLPIYLGDGNHAFLRVYFNWSIHFAQVEFSLRQIDGIWRVQRRVIVYYF